MTYDPGVNKVSLTDEDAVVNPVRGAKSAFYAFITSALSGGVGTTLRTAQDYHAIGTQVKESGNLNSMLLTAMDSQDETLRDQAADLAYQVKNGKNVSSAAVGKMALQAAEEVNREQAAALQENTRQWVERHQEDIKQIDAAETAWEEAWKDPEKRKALLADAEESAQKEQKRSAAAEAARRAAEARQEALRENAIQRRRAAAESQQDGKTPVSVSMAEQLGENGRKAYEYTLEKSGVEEEGIRPAFLACYTYGLAGSAMENVPEEFKSALSGDAAYRAWASGKNDAAISLRNDQEKAKFASLAGEDSGLVYDDFVNEAVKSGRSRVDVNEENRTYLSAETADRINETAKALGLRVQFADSVRGGTANAQISGHTILIEKDNPNPVLTIAGHEFGHRLQELAPEEYRRFRESILEGREQEVRYKAAQYAKQGVNVTYEEAMNEVANDQAGLLMDGGEVLDRFIEKHRSDRSLLQKMKDAIRSFIDKVTGKERKRLETAEGKLEAALNAAAKEVKALQKKTAGDTMGAGKYSLKEDGAGGRENETGRRSEAGGQEGHEETSDREGEERNRRVRRELSASSGRYEGVDPSFGEKPFRTWTEGHVIMPSEGTVSYVEQQTVKEYGVPSFVVSDAAWGRDETKAPAFSVHGQIYLQETIPEKFRGMIAPHEITHVMRQVEFAPYLDFVERTPTMLDMGSAFTQKLLEHTANHQHTTVMDADPVRLYDEFNATLYGHICSGKMGNLVEPLNHVFYDFDAYAKELTELHERFKAENGKGETKFSLKEYTDEEKKQHVKDAVAYFGRTYKWSETGYITTDGKRLDFSGRHEGGPGGYRAVDHRDISDALGLAAVIPADSSEKLQDALSDRNVRVLTYESGNEADRLEKVNSVEDARFSLKTDSQGRELSEEQQKFFKDSKVRDENGQLMIMYRGGNEDFTVFDRKKSRYSNLYGRGFYFTDSEAHARQYGNAKAFYLNITTPVSTTETTITREQMRKFLKAVAANEDDFSFENYGYDATVSSVLKSIYGKSDFAMLYDVNQTAIGDMVAAVELFNEVNGTSYDGLILDTETVAFQSNQIKSVANQKPTSDPDIRYSLKTGTITKSYEAVLEENRLLREQMKDYRSLKKQNRNLQENRDYWKGQTKTTKEVTTDRKAVEKAAAELLKSYSSEADVSDIQERLQNLYDSIARGDEGVSYEEAWKRAEAIAKAVIDKAVAKESLGESYQELLSYLKDTKIRVEEGTKSDIPDYSAFQRQQKGRLSLNSQDGASIDQVYLELAERWPEFFDETEHANPSDQLLQIADVADQLRQVEEYNPFEGDGMDQVVAGAANEILERFFDLPQTKKTFADRQEAKLNAAKARGKQQAEKIREGYKARLEDLRQANRQRVADTIDRERGRADRKIQKLKDRYAARNAAGRERRNARELRAKIIRHTSELSKKLLHPSDKHHIPEKLRTAVSVMLESINLESPYRVDENGKRQKGGSGSPTRRTAAFLALKEQYAHIAAEGGDIVIDPALFGDAALDIQGGFDAVISMKNIRLADMSTEQLQTVWQVVKAVEHSVSTAGKLLSKTKYDGTTAWASAISADTAGRRTKESLTKGHASMDLENPYTFFSHYGEAGQVIFRTLRNAQDQQQMMKSHVAEEAGKIADPATVERLEKSAHTFSTEQGGRPDPFHGPGHGAL